MVDLDALRKELTHFPQGVRWKVLAEKFKVTKTTIYEDLNSLKLKQLAYNQNGLWYPSTEKKPSRFGLFDYLRQRSEIKRREREKHEKELRAAKWNYLELLAKVYPEAEICKDMADIEHKLSLFRLL